MNKKRALSILMAAAMAAGTLVTSVPVYADDVEEITWMFWDDLEATEDLISKGYKEVIDRFNEDHHQPGRVRWQAERTDRSRTDTGCLHLQPWSKHGRICKCRCSS